MNSSALTSKLKQINRLMKAGNPDQAYVLCSKLLKRSPENSGLFHLTGKVLSAAGKHDAANAHFNMAISLGLHSAEVFADNARALNSLGNYEQAESMANAAVTLDSEEYSACRELFKALFAQGKYVAALPVGQKLLSHRLFSSRERILLARNLACTGQYSEALEMIQSAIAHSPSSAECYLVQSQILMDVREWDDAFVAANLALELAPNDAAVITNKAHILEHQGSFEQAFSLIEPLVASNEPAYTPAVHVYSRLAKRFGKLDHAIALLETAVLKKSLSTGMRHSTLNLLGASYDIRGEYDRAFSAIDAGNKVRPSFFDEAAHESSVESMIAWFSKDRFGKQDPGEQTTCKPIFIVGMPRSGTSLTEKILAQHTAVAAGGELPFVATLVANELPVMLAVGDAFPANLRAITTEILNVAAELYVAQVSASVGQEASHITDKMPMNYMFLGLIAMLFPQAKIIHCTRDPMATGWSCYNANFASATDMGFTQNLDQIGRYIKRYERLMAHWHKVLPTPILDLSYEALVSSPDEEIAKLLEFCDLPWEDACLRPHESKQLTMTASYNQVRKPINTKSVDHWRHYEKHLTPLKLALGLKETQAA
jgi:tetratricopeptide (TPR) repeat protein